MLLSGQAAEIKVCNFGGGGVKANNLGDKVIVNKSTKGCVEDILVPLNLRSSVFE